jgi:hypothetical protein
MTQTPSALMGNASEAAAERAIATLRRAIDAAENSNQAGENFVVAAALGPELLKALESATYFIEGAERDTNWSSAPFHMESAAEGFRRLIAKARGHD